MATFFGRYPANTFKTLLNIDNSNAGIDGTLRTVQDGEGTTCPLQLSSSAVNVTSGFSYNSNAISIGGALTFSGAFAFTGTVTGTTTVTFPTTGTLATLAGSETFTNKTLTTPIIAAILTNAGAATVTLPTSTSTLATLALSEAFTNKTYNGLTITSSTGTLTITNGKTLSVSNTLTFTGTDSSSVAFGAGGTVLYNGGALGTPSSGTLTNCSGLPAAGVTGVAITQSNAASQADQELGTSSTTYVSPLRQQYHASSTKAWAFFVDSGTASITASYNMSSITDVATGIYTLNLTTSFTDANYAAIAMGDNQSAPMTACQRYSTSPTSSAFQVIFQKTSDQSTVDVGRAYIAMYGDQ